MKKILLSIILISLLILNGCTGGLYSWEIKENQPEWSITTEEKAKKLYPKYISFIDDCIKGIGLDYSEQIICNHIDGICSKSHENCFYAKKYIFSKDLFLIIELRFGIFDERQKTPCYYQSEFKFRYEKPEDVNLFPFQIFTALEKIEEFCCWGVSGKGLELRDEGFCSYQKIFDRVLEDYLKTDFSQKIDNSFNTISKGSNMFYLNSQNREICLSYRYGWLLFGGGCITLTDENIV